jgi:aspartyl protease family protein
MVRLLMFFLGAVVVMMVVAQGFTAQPAPVAASTQPAQMALAAQPTLAEGFDAEMKVRRDATGQFHLTAQVNGEDAVFLVDTGADAVTLTIAEAERLGIDVDRSTFQPIVRTASGTGNAARIHLDRVKLAGQEFTDVEALVVEGLGVNLLGQTLLRRMGAVELRGDTMIIRRAS